MFLFAVLARVAQPSHFRCACWFRFVVRSAAARGTRTFETCTDYHIDEVCKPMTLTVTVLGDLHPTVTNFECLLV
jgi:hypothetical protein